MGLGRAFLGEGMQRAGGGFVLVVLPDPNLHPQVKPPEVAYI